MKQDEARKRYIQYVCTSPEKVNILAMNRQSVRSRELVIEEQSGDKEESGLHELGVTE